MTRKVRGSLRSILVSKMVSRQLDVIRNLRRLLLPSKNWFSMLNQLLRLLSRKLLGMTKIILSASKNLIRAYSKKPKKLG